MDNKELLEYRSRLLTELHLALNRFVVACEKVADIYVPVDAGGWNVHQLAGHVRDVQVRVYGMRIRMTLRGNEPVFSDFDAEAWMAEHDQREQPLSAILDEARTDMDELIQLLSDLPREAWSFKSRHAIYGERTLQNWVERDLGHLREHLETVERASA